MREVIFTKNAPEAVGPYSQGIKQGNLVFVSGQIPINPETNEVCLGSIEEQTRLVLNNLKAVLEAAGSSLEKALKVTIFLTDMDDFTTVNQIYGEYFTTNPPARACVEVSKLPKNVAVEMEAIGWCE